MKAGQLAKILQAVDPESIVNFEMGDDDHFLFAKAILDSSTLVFPMEAYEATVEQDEEDEEVQIVRIKLWQNLWLNDADMYEHAHRFEEIHPEYKDD